MFEPPTVVGKNPFLHDSLMQKCLLFYIKAQYWQNNGTAVFITHYAIGKVRFMEKYWVLVMFEPPTPPCQWSQDFCTAVGHQSLPISQNRLTCRVAGTKWTKWKSLIYAKQTNWFQASDLIFWIQHCLRIKAFPAAEVTRSETVVVCSLRWQAKWMAEVCRCLQSHVFVSIKTTKHCLVLHDKNK